MTEARNPFVFGRVVADEAFCDRQRELAELREAARTGRSLWLHSPRRFGKTSLLLEAFADTGLPLAYVDVFAAQDEVGLAEAWLKGVSALARQVLRPGERLVEWLGHSVRHLSPQLSVDPVGGVSISLGPRPMAVSREQFDEVVDLPQRLASSRDTHVTVAVDEFQEVTRHKGMEARLRACLQHHDRVTYLFAGSRRTLLADLFTDRDRPFYQFAEHYPLEPIPRDDLVRYVEGRFLATDVPQTEGAAASIVELACGHPHYTQMLASRVWEMARRGDDGDDLVRPANRRWFEALSATARRVVLHVAHQGGEQLLSEQVRRQSRLGASSSVQKALAGLTEREDLLRDEDGSYRLGDPVLAFWLASLE